MQESFGAPALIFPERGAKVAASLSFQILAPKCMTAFEVFIQDSPDSEDEFIVTAPALGRFYPRSEVGDVVTAGTVIGHLKVLHTRTALRLPLGTPSLRVVAIIDGRKGAPVDFRGPLIRVRLGDRREVDANLVELEGLNLPSNAIAIQAPTDGQFFDSMSPDEDAYVVVGDTISVGATIGSIEVMKFFYDVNFDTPTADPNADYQIVKIVAQNATPLRSGDPVAYVVPIVLDEP